MDHIQSKHFRVLAIEPSSRGFGFAVLEGDEMLVDWGIKSVKGNKNVQSLAKAKRLINHYQPDVLVLQDTATERSRRSPRIRALSKKIIAMAATGNVKVALFSHEEVRRVFFDDGRGTKFALAEILAKRFPEQLSSRMPPKRRPWMSEDYRMGIFDPVALVLVFRLKKGKR